MIKEQLRKGLSEWEIELSDTAAGQFELYFKLLEKYNQKMNLTAITDADEAVKLHFLDSAAVLSVIDMQGAEVIDVGTGAGFPGLPMKILRPDIKVTLLDSLEKRVNFLETVSAEIGTEADCVHARAEELAHKNDWRDSFDFAVSRAVSILGMLCELCLPYVKVGGALLAMKTVSSAHEDEAAAEIIEKLGGRQEESVFYTIPGTDIERRIAVIRKVSPTPQGYPRRYSRIKREWERK